MSDNTTKVIKSLHNALSMIADQTRQVQVLINEHQQVRERLSALESRAKVTHGEVPEESERGSWLELHEYAGSIWVRLQRVAERDYDDIIKYEPHTGCLFWHAGPDLPILLGRLSDKPGEVISQIFSDYNPDDC